VQIVITFKNGAETVWKNVRSRELPSIFTDVAALTEKVEAARKAFLQHGGKISGTKKRKVSKSK
jgi:hypothetical protein